MGPRFLVDTNILIEFQGKILPPNIHEFVSSVIDTEFNVSIVNKIELLGSKYATKETEDFIEFATIYELNTAVANTTIQLRKKFKMKLPDAIVAATAIVNNFVLITRNVKDFVNIANLVVINPYDA